MQSQQSPFTRIRNWILIGLLGAGAVVFAIGCDDSDASSPNPTSTPTASPTVPAGDGATDGEGDEDGPPLLEAEADGGTARMGLGSYIWSFDGESRTEDINGVITDARVLTVAADGSIVVSGLGEREPSEVVATAHPRAESGAQEGANRILWERSGDAVELEASIDGSEVTVDLGDLPAGEYVLDLALTFEDGYAEYGVQFDVE